MYAQKLGWALQRFGFRPSLWSHLSNLLRIPTSRKLYTNFGEDTKKISYRRPPFARIITTLDKNALMPSDFIDLSGRIPAIFDNSYLVYHGKTKKWHRRPDLSEDEKCIVSSDLHYYMSGQRDRFSDGTSGFLYYYEAPLAPKITGEIRFCVTQNSDPKSFTDGVDLLNGKGVPWCVPLLSRGILDKYGEYNVLRRRLIQSNLVTESTMDHAKMLVAGTRSHHSPWTRPLTPRLHSFGQPFLIDIGYQATLLFVGPNSIRMMINFIPLSSYAKGESFRPWKGRIICCFERSTLPEHANTRTAVIRVLKFLEPPKRVFVDERTSMPIEGDLMQKDGHPVAYDIDNHEDTIINSCLRILFDNEEQARIGAPGYTSA